MDGGGPGGGPGGTSSLVPLSLSSPSALSSSAPLSSLPLSDEALSAKRTLRYFEPSPLFLAAC